MAGVLFSPQSYVYCKEAFFTVEFGRVYMDANKTVDYRSCYGA